MLKRVLVSFAIAMLAVGSAGAARNPAVSSAAICHQEGQGVAAKDPAQFGPLKLGIDVMVRGEAVDNLSFSDFLVAPGRSDDRLLVRLRPALNLALLSDIFTAHVEGQWYASYGRSEADRVSLYQGYLEGSLPNRKATLKIGRQQMAYGSSFMLGADTFFDGLSYDALKLTVRPSGAFSADFFAGRYTRDNSGGIAGGLYGVYGSYALSDGGALDLYGFLDTGGPGMKHMGKEERSYSVGARLTSRLGRLVSVEVEPVCQFGRHVETTYHREISAFGGHLDLTVDPHLEHLPVKALVSYAFGSGDGTPDRGTFSEFHNPGNDTSLIGDIGVIGDLSGVTVVDRSGGTVHASGLHAVTIGGEVAVTEKLKVSLNGHYFRAEKAPAGISKDLGFESNLILCYQLTDRISLLASANRFFTGGFFKDVTGSGKDINYGYLQLQATY